MVKSKDTGSLDRSTLDARRSMIRVRRSMLFHQLLSTILLLPLSGADLAGVAAGDSHTVALKKDGTVWAWGANWSETWQLSDGTTMDSLVPSQVIGLTGLEASGWPVIPTKEPLKPLADISTIGCGGFHSLGIKKDGALWAWGGNHYWGQLGDGTTEWRTNPVQVKELSEVVAVAGGKWHNVAQKKDGTLWTWGANCHGQLGIGRHDKNPHLIPLRVDEF